MSSGIKFSCVKPGDILYRIKTDIAGLDTITRIEIRSVQANSAVVSVDGGPDGVFAAYQVARLKRRPPEWIDVGRGKECYFCANDPEEGHAEKCFWSKRVAARKHVKRATA